MRLPIWKKPITKGIRIGQPIPEPKSPEALADKVGL